MRILLTGAAGFLGAHMLRRLLTDTDHEAVCPVTFRHKGVPERLVWAGATGEHWDRVTILPCDLAAPIAPITASVFGAVDVILNFASDTHPPRSVTDPIGFWHNNTDIALYLLEYARTLPNLLAFVQVSTDAVYGPALTGTHHEWDPIIPANVYAASKAAQDALGIAYWRSFGVPYMIAATMNPIGLTQDVEKFVPNTIRKVLAGDTVMIHANAEGVPGARTYIDADDVADAILYLLRPSVVTYSGGTRKPAADRPPRWNIVGTRELSNNQVAEIIADELRLPLHSENVKVDRPEHGHRYSLDGGKLAKAGWWPSSDIETTLRRIARWTAENRLWA